MAISKCSICGCNLPDGVMRMNAPSGIRCMDCADKKVKQPKFTKIAGIDVETKLLLKYAEKVDYTRQASRIGSGKNDPILIMKALSDRVEIHKAIFKKVGVDHDSTSKKAMGIRKALEVWLEAHVIEKPHSSNLF